MEKSLFAVFLISTTLSFANVLWADEDLDSLKVVEKVSHKVTHINTFGHWVENQRSGKMRLVVLEKTEQAPHGKLYLQWIEMDAKSEVHVVESVSIDEINNVGVYSLTLPKIVSSREGDEVVIHAVNQYTHDSNELKIIPQAVGKYRIEFTAQTANVNLDNAVLELPVLLDYYSRPTF